MGASTCVSTPSTCVAAYTVPTEAPESDGTLSRTTTTVGVVELRAAGIAGLGFSYATRACVPLVEDVLAPGGRRIGRPQRGGDVGRHGRCHPQPGAPWGVLDGDRRGRHGLVDLKARLLDLPLCDLLGRCRDVVPVYGSGGFTSYDEGELTATTAAYDSRPRLRVHG